MRAKIGKRLLDALPAPPAGKRTIVRDTALAGFSATKLPTGCVTFAVTYGPRNRRRKFTLGSLGALTVELARDLARQRLGDVAHGRDPLDEQRTAAAVPTWGEWIGGYLPDVKLRKKSYVDDKRYLAWAAKWWRAKPLTAITVEDVRKLVEKRRTGSGLVSANRTLASIRTCFAAAWRSGWIESNPAMKVRLLPEGPPRARVLSDEEMQRVLAALEGMDAFTQLAFALLIETGARKSEVLRARWEDLDLDGALWRLPSPKAGKPQVIPLPGPTVARLRNTPHVGDYVIPGNRKDGSRASLRKQWAKIREAADIEDVTIHDVRRTFGLQVARRAGLHVASRLLRHSSVQITEAAYAPLGIEELRQATEQHAAKVIELNDKRKRKGARDGK